MGSLTSTQHVSASRLRHKVCGFAYTPPYTLTPALPPTGLSYPPASPHRLTTTHQVPSHHNHPRKGNHSRWLAQQGSSGTLFRGYGNINPLSIDYASRPRLRPRLTQGGLAWPWNPWSFGGRVSHPSFATHACILTRVASTAGSHRRFTRHTTLPYPSTRLDTRCLAIGVNVTASAVCLSPASLSARNHLTSELLRTL
jgi:hypothetical protein